jgi:hypothetical protein
MTIRGGLFMHEQPLHFVILRPISVFEAIFKYGRRILYFLRALAVKPPLLKRGGGSNHHSSSAFINRYSGRFSSTSRYGLYSGAVTQARAGGSGVDSPPGRSSPATLRSTEALQA